MKCLKRNMTEFEYYAYTGLDSDIDEDGLHTGVYKPVYDGPIMYSGNISAPSGSAIQTFGGLDIRYTNVLVMDDPNVDIRETGYIRCKGKNYEVTAVRPSLNSVAIALREKTEDHGDQEVFESVGDP